MTQTFISIFAILLLAPLVHAKAPNVVLSDAERREALASEIASEAFQAKLDVLSMSQRISGNEALLLLNGKMSFPVRFALIDNAKKSIVLSTFSLFAGEHDGQIEDPSTRTLVKKLIAAKQRGVEIKIISDGFASALTGAKSAINPLREAGITFIKYNPVIHQDFELNWIMGLPHFLYRIAALQNPTTNRWHEKTLIVDGLYAIVGGLNWGNHYKNGNDFSSAVNDAATFFEHPLVREIGVNAQPDWGDSYPDAWRDTDVLVKGPVVSAILKQLLLDFSILEVIGGKRRNNQYKNATEQDYAAADKLFTDRYRGDPRYFPSSPIPPSPNGGVARYVSQRPFLNRRRERSKEALRSFAEEQELYVNADNPMLGVSNLYINLINKAQKQILWGCHANRPTPDVLDALVAAARRGVQVYLLGNSLASAETLPGNGKILYGKAYRLYDDLLTKGSGNIRLFEWRREMEIDAEFVKSGAFHSKVFSVDGVIASVGPYNMAKASFGKHTEGTIVIIDPEFARRTEKMFQDDLNFSNEVTLAHLAADRLRRRRRELLRSHHTH